jgi:hypothetical protein
MRLPRLLAALAVTAMAFALFGANARAATLNPGGRIDYTVTLQGGQATPTDLAGIFCPDPLADSGPVQMCGHVVFTTTGAGVVTATATFPNDAQIDLVLCSVDGTQGIPSPACRVGQTEIPCARTQVIGPTTTTVTISCLTTPGTFELVIVPNLTPCNNITLSGCENTTVTGSVTLSSGGGGSTGGTGATAGKVSGGGKVDFGASTFSVMAIADVTKYDQAHVKYQQKKGGCRFRAVRVTRVAVVSNPSNPDPNVPPPDGYADIDGFGFTNSSTMEEFFQAHIEDGGEGKDAAPDAFSLNSDSGCSTTSPTLTSGNTQIHPTHN